MTLRFHAFETRAELARDLAGRLLVDLSESLAKRPRASLALSGGQTPGRLLAELAGGPVTLHHCDLVAVDDRWVDPTSPRSNEALLRAALGHREEQEVRIWSLVTAAASPEEALASIRKRLEAFPFPLDACVLGMGNDGHTASLFPEGDRLAEGLDLQASGPCISMRAPAAPEPRMTLTLATIVSARHLYLHFEGQSKRALFEDLVMRDVDASRAPIVAVLRERPDIEVFWAPEA